MGCAQSSDPLPATGSEGVRRPKHLKISTDRPSIRVRVVTTPSGDHISPKNSSLGELGIYDLGEGEAVPVASQDHEHASCENEVGKSDHKSKYVFRSEANKTGKRPRLDFSAMQLVECTGERKADEPDGVDEDIYTIDDIADTFVEVSTDDDSSDDDSDDGFISESNSASSAQSFDETIEHMAKTGGNDLVTFTPSLLLSSDGSSQSPLRKSSMNSGSMSPDLHGSMSPLLPVRKGSGKWRTSSVLSPAVARVSRDVFPRDISSTADTTTTNTRNRGLDRFRNLSGKIRIGVRLGIAVKKASDMHGMKRINQYLIIKVLGEGSYGKVKLVEDQNTGKQYAMKILKKIVRKTSRRLSIHGSKDTVVGEIAIMKKLNHPNVVRLHEVLETNNQVYLVLEYRRQGPVVDLEGEMKRQEMSGQWSSDHLSSPQCPKLALETVRTYTRDIVKGLSYLHAHSVIHQDLKPNNLLLGQDGSIAISDFGISTIIQSKSDLVRITNNGTPAFMAPELHGAQKSAHSGQASDLWSVGVILYCFVAGRLPFWAPSVIQLAEEIRNSPIPPMPTDLQLPEAFTELVHGLLNKDPSSRMTLAQVAENKWITRNGRKPLVITTKDSVQQDTLVATGFEMNAAFSFAKIVRIKAKINRFVANARAPMQKQQQQNAEISRAENEPARVSSTGRLRRRSVTNKSLIANASRSEQANKPTSLTSYRSRGPSLIGNKPRRNVNGAEPSRVKSTESYGAELVSESGESDYSEDDLGDDEVVTVEDGAELEFHLMPKPSRGRKKRRYSEVIPGRVMLSGLVSLRNDCVNHRLGIVCSNHSDINGRASMEDRQISIASVNQVMCLDVSAPPMAFFGVYDGHSGQDCAEFVRLNLHNHIFSDIDALVSDPQTTLKRAFAACDKSFLRSATEDSEQIVYSGSTATVAFLLQSTVYVAGVGDSRAVLARQGRAMDLTTDHVPTIQSETERIHRAGGSVVRGRVQGVLGVSRAFGDIEFKTLKEKSWGSEFAADLISVEPEICVVEIQPEDEFIIIASDGLYDCFTSQRVVGRFKSHLQETTGDLQESLRLLVQDAAEMRPGHDNIMATAILFTGGLATNASAKANQST